MSDEKSETPAPVLRIESGSPSAEEVAVIAAVLSAMGGGDGGSQGPTRSHWAAPDTMVRPSVRPAPGAWRFSAFAH